MAKKIILCLTIAFTFLLFIYGCGDVSDSEDSERPRVVNVSVTEGGTIPTKSPIDITFSKPMKSVEIGVYMQTCDQFAEGQIEINDDTVRWTWPTYTPTGFDWGFTLAYSGNCTLSVSGVDESGLELEKFESINFRVSGPG